MANILEQLSTELAETVQSTDPSVVKVDGRRRLPATGIVWSADGVIVSAHHVVERDEDIHVTLADGTTLPATLVGRDPEIDIVVLRVEADNLTPAKWAEWDGLNIGNLVLALGKAGSDIQATLGVVSAIGEMGEGRGRGRGRRGRHHGGGNGGNRRGERFIRTDVVMYPGFSGGPLVDGTGAVRGMNTSIINGMSIAIPTSTINKSVQMLLEHGHIKRGYLGITTQPVALPDNIKQELEQETGLLVMATEATSPAAQSGLVLGDVLIKFNDEAVSTVDDLMSLLTTDLVGATVPAQILRAGSLHNVQLTVGERP